MVVKSMQQTAGDGAVAHGADAKSNTVVVAQASAGVKRRRWKSGVVAQREIVKLSKSTSNVFPEAPFRRLVHEIADEIKPSVRFEGEAMDALHESAEQFTTERFLKADLARRFAKRYTLHPLDIQFAEYISDAPKLIDNVIFQRECQDFQEQQDAREAKKRARMELQSGGKSAASDKDAVADAV